MAIPASTTCCRLVALAALATAVSASAQPPKAPLPLAALIVKESTVRQQFRRSSPAAGTLADVRRVVSEFEALSARTPAGEQGPDALWRAARLSEDAYDMFRDPQEVSETMRLLQALITRYPRSPLATRARAQLEAEYGIPDIGSSERPARGNAAMTTAESEVSPPSAPAQLAPPVAETTQLVMVKRVHQSTIGDVVRVEIEVEREVAFRHGRLGNPARVYVDLSSTRIPPSIWGQTFRFSDGADAIHRVRLWQRPRQKTRVIVEKADGVSTCRVGSLADPFRLVIDCDRPSSSVRDRRPAAAKAAEDLFPSVDAPGSGKDLGSAEEGLGQP